MDSAVFAQAKKNTNLLQQISSIKGYGVGWDKESDSLVRIGDAKNLSRQDFDFLSPWKDMKRCNVADDGTINAYLGDDSYAEDGSNGQVMVEIPKFWYKVETVYSTNNYGFLRYRWYISPKAKEGFSVHPAFIRDGVEKDYIYIGAYEATVYDSSAGSYVGDGITYDYSNDKLASVANLQPISGDSDNLDITQFRQMAQNRGSGWEQRDFLTTCAIQLLYLIEYADFDAQTQISEGITNLDSGSNNHSQNTGHTSSLGNKTGEVVITSFENGATSPYSETYAMSYRGIENFYGNIWEWVDGINIKADYNPWVADHGFQSDLFESPYEDTGITVLGTSDTYIQNIVNVSGFDYSFLASEGGGSSSTYLCDNWWIDIGNKVARFGGAWNRGALAGGFCWALVGGSASSYRTIGGRLLLIP